MTRARVDRRGFTLLEMIISYALLVPTAHPLRRAALVWMQASLWPAALAVWALAAAALLTGMGALWRRGVPPMASGTVCLVMLAAIGVASCWRPPPSPRGGRPVSVRALVVRGALAATAVCSLSADPPRVIACINRNGITYEMISKSRKLGINILSAAHQTLAMRFAGMMDIGDVDRFGEGKWRTLSTGAPILDDALTAFDCTLNVSIDVGSHAIIVADIVDAYAQRGG